MVFCEAMAKRPTRRAKPGTNAGTKRETRPVITTARGAEPIRTRVSMPDPRNHEYHVEMRVPALPDRTEAEIVFPAWAPGSYMIRDFVRHVYGLAITDGRGRPIARVRLDKQRWRVTSGGAPFVVKLPRLRLRIDRANIVPGRQPRLLERNQPVFRGRWRNHQALPN